MHRARDNGDEMARDALLPSRYLFNNGFLSQFHADYTVEIIRKDSSFPSAAPFGSCAHTPIQRLPPSLFVINVNVYLAANDVDVETSFFGVNEKSNYFYRSLTTLYLVGN